jgi:hypothetical protein
VITLDIGCVEVKVEWERIQKYEIFVGLSGK